MDVSKILAEVKAERAQIEEAILSLERLARGRGRPPGSKTPPDDLPPAAAMGIPLPRRGLVWAVAEKKQPDTLSGPAESETAMDLSKVLEELKAQRSESDPPLEGMGVGVRVPRPKPKLPPAAAAVRPPREKKADH